MSTVTLHNSLQFITQEVPVGTNLLAWLRREGIFLDAPCGGNGSCGKCRVRLDGKEVLACQTQITQDCSIHLPEHITLDCNTKSVTQACSVHLSEHATGLTGSSVSPTEEAKLLLPVDGRVKAAVDLGTTTLALSIYPAEAKAGDTPLAVTGAWNAQIPYGADVISRIKYCMDHADGLDTLSHAIRTQVMQLISRAFRGTPELTELTIAGNTILQHLFAGLDPSSIAQAPFSPLTLFREDKEWLFPETGAAKVRFLPCIAGYVGGDITAGMWAMGLPKASGLCLFLDIGTNGEMALCEGDKLLCCSVASGPAFEGAEISCGMRSTAGAIRHFSLADGRLQAEVIGDGPAEGICGSGLVDLLAILLAEEVVDETGLLPGPEDIPLRYRACVTEDENGNGIFSVSRAIPGLACRHEIYLTAKDVRKLQLAKAAVRAGIETLLRHTGHRAGEITELMLAGGFGKHLNPKSMISIGMLPPALAGCTRAIGNSSLAGAKLLLLTKHPSRTAPLSVPDLLKLCDCCTYLELSTDPGFAEEYIDQMFF